MDMRSELLAEVSIGSKVCITFINGKEITGYVQEYGEDMLSIIDNLGKKKLIAFSLIGYYEESPDDALSSDAVAHNFPEKEADSELDKLKQEMETPPWTIDELLRQLKDADNAVYSACQRQLSSYQYALKVKETTPRYGRIAPVINNIISMLAEEKRDIQAVLLNIIGLILLNIQEASYMENSAGLVIEKLFFSNQPDTRSCSLAIRLVVASSQYDVLEKRLRNIGVLSREQFGIIYAILDKCEQTLTLPVNQELLHESNIKYIIKQYCDYSATHSISVKAVKHDSVQESPHQPQPCVNVSPALNQEAVSRKIEPLQPDEAAGEIFFYNQNRAFGIIKSDHSTTFTFVLTEVADLELHDALEYSNPRNIKGTYVAFTTRPFFDQKTQQNRQVASKIRRIEASMMQPSRGVVPSQVQLNPNVEAKLKDINRSFVQGKEWDGKTLEAYLAFIDTYGPNETAVKNVVSIYQRSANSDQALAFLKKYKNSVTSEQYHLMAYQIYMQMENYEEALASETEIVKLTMRPANKLHHLLLIANMQYKLMRFYDAIDSCTKWVSTRQTYVKELYSQTVSNVAKENQICILVAHCVVRIRKEDDSYQPPKALNALIQNNEDALNIIKKGFDEETHEDRFFGDFRDWLNPIVQKLLANVALRDHVDLRKLDSNGEYLETAATARKDSEALVKFSTTQKPYIRYSKCIAAARILYDAMNNQIKVAADITTDYSTIESEMFTYVAKALVSLADDIVGRPEIDIHVSIFYYLESLKYTKTDAQDKQNALVRSILASFSKRADIPLTIKNYRNLSTEDIKNALDNSDTVNIQEFINAIIHIYHSSLPEQREDVLRRLCNTVQLSRQRNAVAQYLQETNLSALSNSFSTDELVTALKMRHDRFSQIERDWIKMINTLRCIQFTPSELGKALDEFSLSKYEEFDDYIDTTEKKRISDIRTILAQFVDFYQQETYSAKETKLKSLVQDLTELNNLFSEQPTKYSFEYLSELTTRWKNEALSMLQDLYQSKIPELDCNIIKNDLHMTDEHHININFDISNNGDRQTADSLIIGIANSDEYDVVALPEKKYYIPGGRGETIQAELAATDAANVAFSMKITVEYDYNLSASEKKHEQKTFELSFVLDDSVFDELANPYEAYASGNKVEDERMVFGRTEFISSIVQFIAEKKGTPLRGKTIALYGQKRTGKSTILYHLERKLKAASPTTIVVGLGDISKWRAEHFERQLYRSFFQNITSDLFARHGLLLEAMNEASIVIPEKNVITDDTCREIFSDFLTNMNSLFERDSRFSSYNIVMLLDEFTNIYMHLCKEKIDSEFMKYWKAIINDFGLVAVVVGQDYMNDFVQAYPNPFGAIDRRPVTYLPENEARRMIEQPPVDNENCRLLFSGDPGKRAIERILRLTAGSAYYLMIFMDRLVKHLNTVHQRYVTDADIDRLLTDVLLSGHDSLDLPKFESLYYDDGDISDSSRPRDNVAVLWMIAQKAKTLGRCRREDIYIQSVVDTLGIDSDRIKALLAKLVSRNVVELDSNGNYSIIVELFAEWLYHNCSIESIINIRDI